MYSSKQFINIGMKNIDIFGRYRSLSDRDNSGGGSVVFESFSSSNNDDELASFGSLINRKAASPTNGTASIIYNVVVGVNPMPHNAAYKDEAITPDAPPPEA